MTITAGYAINADGTRKMVSIYCRSCGHESFNPDDVRHKFCGQCNDYHQEGRTTIELMLVSLERAGN